MTRTFTFDDQARFARISGDYNPMHIDPVAARRLLFGRPVVHGIHAVLWGIDVWLQQMPNPVRLKTLNASFRAPIIVNDPVELVIEDQKESSLRFEITAGGVKLATVNATFELDQSNSDKITIPSTSPELTPCRELTLIQAQRAAGRLPLLFDRSLAADLLPTASRLLPPDQLAALLATTRVIGMQTPGLHSIYTGFELTAPGDEKSPDLIYATENFDERFSLFTIKVNSPAFAGALSAAMRPPPTAQPRFTHLQQVVKPGEFASIRALVIGGSRGIGEVAVKALAAGGADVKFTYHRGIDDAKRIADEISAGGLVDFFAYDYATDANQLQKLVSDWSPTLLCYFATPFIFSAIAGRFSPNLFRQFCDCYVDGFHQTFQAANRLGNNLTRVICPSSSAVDELPLNMGEYAAAKSASETLCRFLEKTHKTIRFLRPRLPRLATDQTATLLAVESADPTQVILMLLREKASSPI